MTTPMTREEFVATLSEYAVACAINGWVPGDSPEKSWLYAHDAALRARLAEAEAILAPMAAAGCQSPRTRGLALFVCGGCWPCRAKRYLAPERPA